MNRSKMVALGICLTLGASLMISGCGGSNNGVVFPSAYAGNWSGTWTNNTVPPGPTSNTGNTSIVIAQSGHFSGSVSLSPSNVTETVNGEITSAGQVSGTLKNGNTVTTFTGSVSSNLTATPATISMNLNEGSPTVTATDTISLTN